MSISFFSTNFSSPFPCLKKLNDPSTLLSISVETLHGSDHEKKESNNNQLTRKPWLQMIPLNYENQTVTFFFFKYKPKVAKLNKNEAYTKK